MSVYPVCVYVCDVPGWGYTLKPGRAGVPLQPSDPAPMSVHYKFVESLKETLRPYRTCAGAMQPWRNRAAHHPCPMSRGRGQAQAGGQPGHGSPHPDEVELGEETRALGHAVGRGAALLGRAVDDHLHAV